MTALLSLLIDKYRQKKRDRRHYKSLSNWFLKNSVWSLLLWSLVLLLAATVCIIVISIITACCHSVKLCALAMASCGAPVCWPSHMKQ